MTMYEFQVHSELPLEQPDSEQWLDALFEAGCDDAIVGLARPGYLSLDFSREGEEAMVVVQSAVGDVQTAIPGRIHNPSALICSTCQASPSGYQTIALPSRDKQCASMRRGVAPLSFTLSGAESL